MPMLDLRISESATLTQLIDQRLRAAGWRVIPVRARHAIERAGQSAVEKFRGELLPTTSEQRAQERGVQSCTTELLDNVKTSSNDCANEKSTA